MKIGLIGCGSIGSFLLKSINKNKLLPNGKITAIYTRNTQVSTKLAEEFQTKAYSSIDSLLHSEVDLVIEAATIEAANEYAINILDSGKHLLLSSIGAMADSTFETKVKESCLRNKVNVFLPSGAIGGLDIIKAAAAVNGLETVSITTRKPLSALPVDEKFETAKELFNGSAAEAIKHFPRNMNVAIALSLAGIGIEKTLVKVIADPTVDKNTHVIEASGSFGQFKLVIENNPMPNNPKTSYLAALSAFSAIHHMNQAVHIG